MFYYKYICSRFGFENDVIYNRIKSTRMIVKPHGFHLKCLEVYMDNSKLEFVEKAKYLGAIICSCLKNVMPGLTASLTSSFYIPFIYVTILMFN